MTLQKPSNEIMANIKARANGASVVTPASTGGDLTISADDKDLLELHASMIEAVLKRIE